MAGWRGVMNTGMRPRGPTPQDDETTRFREAMAPLPRDDEVPAVDAEGASWAQGMFQNLDSLSGLAPPPQRPPGAGMRPRPVSAVGTQGMRAFGPRPVAAVASARAPMPQGARPRAPMPMNPAPRAFAGLRGMAAAPGLPGLPALPKGALDSLPGLPAVKKTSDDATSTWMGVAAALETSAPASKQPPSSSKSSTNTNSYTPGAGVAELPPAAPELPPELLKALAAAAATNKDNPGSSADTASLIQNWLANTAAGGEEPAVEPDYEDQVASVEEAANDFAASISKASPSSQPVHFAPPPAASSYDSRVEVPVPSFFGSSGQTQAQKNAAKAAAAEGAAKEAAAMLGGLAGKAMPAELTGMEMLKVAAEAPSSGASARPAGAVGGYAMASMMHRAAENAALAAKHNASALAAKSLKGEQEEITDEGGLIVLENVPPGTSQGLILAECAKYGTVASIHYNLDTFDALEGARALVKFTSQTGAQAAVTRMSKRHTLFGAVVPVEVRIGTADDVARKNQPPPSVVDEEALKALAADLEEAADTADHRGGEPDEERGREDRDDRGRERRPNYRDDGGNRERQGEQRGNNRDRADVGRDRRERDTRGNNRADDGVDRERNRDPRGRQRGGRSRSREPERRREPEERSRGGKRSFEEGSRAHRDEAPIKRKRAEPAGRGARGGRAEPEPDYSDYSDDGGMQKRESGFEKKAASRETGFGKKDSGFEKVLPVVPVEQPREKTAGRGFDSTQEGPEAPSGGRQVSTRGHWAEFATPDNRQYYVNILTGEKTWVKPEGYAPPGAKKTDGNSNVYVGNLPAGVNEILFRQLFEPYGNIISLRVEPSRVASGGTYGFVKFDCVASAQRAIKAVSGKPWNGKTISCRTASAPS